MKTAWISLLSLALAGGYAVGRAPTSPTTASLLPRGVQQEAQQESTGTSATSATGGKLQEAKAQGAKAQDDKALGEKVLNEKAKQDANDPVWHETVLSIARHYRLWEPLESTMRWAPQLCMMPPPPSARPSKAKEKTPHARKLYGLYVKDPLAYGAKPTGLKPEGEIAEILAGFDGLEQVVVKEAWKPVKMDAAPTKMGPFDEYGPSGLRPVQKDGTWYRPGPAAGLFVMFKPRETAAQTDAGWIYATVEANGKVSGSGRMASCMECHTKHEDRLFGLPKDSTARRD